MIRRIALVALAAATLGACTPQATTAPTTETTTKDQGPNRQDVSGRVNKAQGDVAKAEVVLHDEAGAAVADVKAVKPNSTGAFTFPLLSPGIYFAVATYEDKSSAEGLLSSQTYYNPISPGSSLAAAFAHNLLATKLVFVEDLPLTTFSGLTAELDSVMTSRSMALQAGQDARLNQFNQLRNANAKLTNMVTDIEETINGKHAANVQQRPPYATQEEYDAKKKKLGV